jgi:hypothetical protein
METIKKGSRKERSVILLQAILKEVGFEIEIDGKFGRDTQRIVEEYQRKNDLVSDGIVGEKTWIKLCSQAPDLLKRASQKYLNEKDIENLSDRLHVEKAVIKAVNEVESHGAGFIIDKPKILFEGHCFWKRLKARKIDPRQHKFNNEDILYAKWTKKYYKGGLTEYKRLEKAKKINEEAALESASWGLFQIMGFNFKNLGYPSIHDFVKRIHSHEGEHLEAFGRFVERNNLLENLRNHEWRKFALNYNGKGYKKNRYHIKLEMAYKKYSRL